MMRRAEPQASEAPPLSTREIALVQRSFDQLWSKNEQFVTGFYERFFQLAPQARSLFHGDFAGQRVSLMAMLAAMVGSLDQPALFWSLSSQGASRHASYGVQPEHYKPFGEAMISGLSDVLGPSFTPETERAWRSLYLALARLHTGALNTTAVA